MKSATPLRTRLVIVVMAAIVPLFGLSIVKAWLDAKDAISRATEDLKFSASVVAISQQRIIESARQLLSSIATAPGLNSESPDCHPYFKNLRDQFPVYTDIGIVDLNGRFACHSHQGAGNVLVRDRDYFSKVLTTKGFVSGGYSVGRLTGKPIIVFALPVASKGSPITGVAVASVDLAQVSKAVTDLSLPGKAHLTITDPKGVVLVTNPHKANAIGSLVSNPVLLEAAKTMRSGQREGLDEQGATQIFAFHAAGAGTDSPFFVALSAERDDIVAPIKTQLGIELAVLALVAGFGGALAWLMAGRVILKPANLIVEATKRVSEGRLDARVPLTSAGTDDEFNVIAQSFNLMADTLQQHHAALETELARSSEAQEKLRDAQRLGRIGYWQLDVATNNIWWSDEVDTVLGVDAKTFDGSYQSLLQLIHSDDRPLLEAAHAKAAQFGDAIDLEYRVIDASKQVRWIHHFGRAHTNGPGKAVARRSGVIQEITQRKQAALAIARNTELLNRTGELAKIGGWELMLDSNVLIFSDEVYKIHGLDFASSPTLEQALSFYSPEAQPVIRGAIQAAIEHGESWDLVLPFVTAQGRPLKVRVQGRPLMREGKAHRLIGVLQDVTEQQQAEEQLRLLETALSRLNDIVIITEASPIDEPGPKIVYVNDAFERQTGYSRAEALGRSPRFLQGPKTERGGLGRIASALAADRPVRAEFINYRKNGEEFWVELEIVPMTNAQGKTSHFVSVNRDITERKHAGKALIDSERRYAALFEAAPVPMWLIDAQSLKFIAVNGACTNSYGYSVEEFLTMDIFDIRSEVEGQRVRAEISAGSYQPVNRRLHKRKDGSEFNVETVSNPVQYDGRAARLVVAFDVTAQTQAERELQQYLFTLQRAADAAQAISWHKAMEATLQETVEQARGVIGVHKAVLTLPGDNETARSFRAVSYSEKYADQRSAEGTSGFDIGMDQVRRPIHMTQAELLGHPRWRSLGLQACETMRGWLAVPLISSTGQTIGVLQMTDKYEGDFTQQDVYVTVELAQMASIAIENVRLFEQVNTLNSRLEEKVVERTSALVRQEAFSRALTEQAPQVVWNANVKGELTYANRRWYELVGGEPEDWLGNAWIKAVHPEDREPMQSNWEKASQTLTPYVGTRRIFSRDGSYHTMSYRASPVLNEKGEVDLWVGIDADVTEIKAIENALRLSNRELEAFSYSVSHDLRSPLNTIDGFSRLLAKQLGNSGQDKVQHYLARIQAGVAQMGRLIEDLLALAQVSRTELRLEPIDLTAISIEILGEWQGRHPERRAIIKVDEDLRTQGDGRLIRVLMENLLGNAWKFSARQSLAEITVGHQTDAAGMTVFFVRDNGAGFDMAYADKLFHTFQRLHAVSEFPGTGVGLATVSRVIGRHGGQIWARSKPEQGATFFFTLPGNAWPDRH